VPLAYYSRAATAEFWREHWGGHALDALLAEARRSPLTALLLRHLPPEGAVLEAGCGPGQYVLLLRERGRRAVGADWSFEALRAAAARGAPLAAMDLRRLAARDGAFAAYVSLGVVEHDPAGPAAILAEAARVLAPGGVLLLSVPYWNGARWLLGPWVRRRQRRLREAGAEFYQFAFTRAELRAVLVAAGFAPRAFRPYDPARMPRALLRRLRPRRAGGAAAAPRPGGPAGPGRARGTAARLLRRALYSPPALRLLGHMLLAVAVRR
jgi:SAM-dependent methyltransferase